MSKPVIRIENVTRTYHAGDVDVHALRNVSMTVEPGEFIAIVGSSGSGKSTLMAMLGCLDRPTSGRYYFEGVDVAGLSEPELARIRSERLGFVFQSFNLLARTSAAENVALPLFYAASGPAGVASRSQRAREALELMGLGDRVRNTPAQLSGGQQQRVALARALITNPSVLLLDEPLSALDPFLRGKMRDELKRLQIELGISFIHVTHSQEEALALADLSVVMDGGRIQQASPARDLFDKPRTAFVARFIGGQNVLPGTKNGEIAVRTDRCHLIGIDDPVSETNLPGAITAIEYQGARVQVTLTIDGGREAISLLPDDTFFAKPFKIGERARIAWSPGDIHPLATP